ncbi:tRNA (adenosine(37)-N6)-dimethylallyltransferase MiaA [Muribaculaceae bacterium Isolate-104 (HZI)]|jgi:tRNA dimethylallyltransferase|nr:tRNA (adenosine(37)-N6)-dimethylallyltransferase MiaA [Muribaculaceae bacterium Isolate-104 (HZI)]
MKYPVITGPTASGKTALAVALASDLDGEIISADSRQIYTGMDIGTGKDLEEYGSVPYHLIDIAPAGYKYNLFEYLRDAREAMDNILARGKVPVVCGGTGMYLEALVRGTHLPEVPINENLRSELSGKSLEELSGILKTMKNLHNSTDIDTAKRAIRAIEIQTYYHENPDAARDVTPGIPDERAVIVGVDIDRETRRRRISDRLHARIKAGMIDEVKALLDSGIAPEDLIYYGLEYKFVTSYITGQMSLERMTESLEIAIHQFAKRQMTWFRGMERRGFKIHWLPYDMPAKQFVSEVKILLAP